jgi:branched-chain amino acid aminotransferase
VLEGITRRTVIELARNLGEPVVERALDRSELYTADELFFTGTAAGITFVKSVDHRVIGEGTIGPLTRELTAQFARVTSGRDPKYRSFVTPTYANRNAGAA